MTTQPVSFSHYERQAFILSKIIVDRVLMGVYNHFHHTRNGDIIYKYEVKWDKETNTVSCGALSLQRYTEMTPDNFFSKVTGGKNTLW